MEDNTVKKEKKPMKKGLKAFLVVLVILVFIAAASFSVKLYFDHENSKPVFTLPEIDPLPSATVLPTDAETAAQYVNRLYGEALAKDDAEGSWRTDVNLSGDIVSDAFSDAERDLIQFIRDRAAGQIASYYPSASGVVMATAEEKPAFEVDPAEVTEFDSRQGNAREDGKLDNEEVYYINFRLNTDGLDPAALANGEIAKAIEKDLETVVSVDALEIVPQSYTVEAQINRVTDQLTRLYISRGYTLKVSVTFKNEYAALTADGKAQLELPYTARETISFSHYGARFNVQQIAVKPNDMDAIPATITINADATPEDYEWTFDISDPEAITIDADGVMRVEKAAEEAVTVKMTLKYNGHVYSDTLTVYITEMEVDNGE